MRYFVTGASGFIGTNLIGYLHAHNETVLGVDIVEPKVGSANADLPFEIVDVLDRTKLNACINQFNPDYVIHLGARTDLLGENQYDYRANVEGVENIVASCKQKTGIKKTIFASSRLVFEISAKPSHMWDYSPTTEYGKSKVSGELIVRNSGMDWPWAIVRPTSIWGPWFDVPYRTFFDAIRKSRYVHPKGVQVCKSFGYVGNCIAEIEAICKNTSAIHSAYFLADYQPIDVLLFANQIANEMKVRSVREVNHSVLELVAKLGDMAKAIGYKWSPLTTFRLNNIKTNMVYDLTETMKILPNLPYSTEDGIKYTVKWLVAAEGKK